MKNILIFSFSCFLIVSCKHASKTVYDHEKLSFRISEDFKIVKRKTWKRNHATYVRMNHKGSGSNEYISLTWLPKKYDLDKELQNFVDSRVDAYKDDERGGAIFDEAKPVIFASNAALQSNYEVVHEGTRGSYTVFHCHELTIVIGRHYTRLNEASFNKCIQIMEESISCK